MREKAEAVILEHAKLKGVDVLDSDFVDTFIEATGCEFKVMPYGANKCEYLSRSLSRMYLEGSLNRFPVGIPAMPVSGFPKWVYRYTINYDCK